MTEYDYSPEGCERDREARVGQKMDAANSPKRRPRPFSRHSLDDQWKPCPDTPFAPLLERALDPIQQVSLPQPSGDGLEPDDQWNRRPDAPFALPLERALEPIQRVCLRQPSGDGPDPDALPAQKRSKLHRPQTPYPGSSAFSNVHGNATGSPHALAYLLTLLHQFRASSRSNPCPPLGRHGHTGSAATATINEMAAPAIYDDDWEKSQEERKKKGFLWKLFGGKGKMNGRKLARSDSF